MREFFLNNISCKEKFTNHKFPVVVLSHGFASHKDKKRFKIFDNFPNYFAFDYPGHNKSKGELDFEEFKKTLITIIEYLIKKGFKDFIFITESLGNLVLFSIFDKIKNFKEKNKIRKIYIVGIGPVLKPKLIKTIEPYLNDILENGHVIIGRRNYKVSLEFLKQILNQKIKFEDLNFEAFYVFYGKNDDKICYEELKKDLEKINVYKELIIIENGDHVLENKTHIVYYFVSGLINEMKW